MNNLDQCQKLIANGDFEIAYNICMAAIEADQNDHTAWWMLSRLSWRMAYKEEALDFLVKALDLSPSSEVYVIELAGMQIQQGLSTELHNFLQQKQAVLGEAGLIQLSRLLRSSGMAEIRARVDELIATSYPHLLLAGFPVVIPRGDKIPELLIHIVQRFFRAKDASYAQLLTRLENWQHGIDTDECESAWRWLVFRVLTRPHFFAFLFPSVCESDPALLSRIQKFANIDALPPTEQAEIIQACQEWIASQSDTRRPDSFFSKLLEDLLVLSPEQGGVFEFLSRYYTLIDLLVAHFVDQDLYDLHDKIFYTLFLQRRYWPSAYCHGYLYQGWEQLGLSGIKPIDARLESYSISHYLNMDDHILDIGSNSGFLALALAKKTARVDAIELNPFMIEIGRKVADYVGCKNIHLAVADVESWTANHRYDAVFSLANHCTIDGRMAMNFEEYIAKIFTILKPNGYLFFESHNVFGPGSGASGDDGDLDLKFDTVEKYFEVLESRMIKAFVPVHDIDKLFVVLSKRAQYTPDAVRVFQLEQAIRTGHIEWSKGNCFCAGKSDEEC